MKTIFTVLILFLFTDTMAQNWQSINKTLWDYNVNDVCAVDENNIIAVGDFGSVYKVHLGVSGDDDTEYIRADDNDGSFNDVNYIDESFLAVGENGMFYKSDSTGENWQKYLLTTDENLIAIGKIGVDIIIVGETKIYKVDDQNFKIKEIFDLPYNYNYITFANDIIYAVGDNGLLFTYNGSNYREHDSGTDEDITVIFYDDNGNIYFTPKNSRIIKANESLDSLIEIELTQPIDEVFTAGMVGENNIAAVAVIESNYLELALDIDNSRLYISPFISGVSAQIIGFHPLPNSDISFYHGPNGLLGLVYDTQFGENFRGFNLHFNIYLPSLDIIDLIKNETGSVYIRGNNSIKTMKGDWNITDHSEERNAYPVGNAGGKNYYLGKTFNATSRWRQVLYYIENGNRVDIDTSLTGAQRYKYYENDNKLIAYGNRMIYVIDKNTFTPASIDEPDFFISSLIEHENGIYYAASGNTIHSSNDLVNWKLFKENDNNYDLPTLISSGSKLYLGDNTGLFHDKTYIITDLFSGDTVTSFYSGQHITYLEQHGTFIGLATGLNSYISYSRNGGTSWTIDSVDNANQIYGVLEFNDHLVAYSQNDIFIKPITVSSVNENHSRWVTQDYTIFPNPSNAGETVSISNLSFETDYNAEYTLVNLNGSIIDKGYLNNNTLTLPPSLASQNYYLLINQSGQIYTTVISIE